MESNWIKLDITKSVIYLQNVDIKKEGGNLYYKKRKYIVDTWEGSIDTMSGAFTPDEIERARNDYWQ